MIADKFTVTSTAQVVVPRGGAGSRGRSCIIKNPTGGNLVYLGGSSVNSTDGFPLAATETISIDATDEDVYAITATTQDINILYAEK